MLTIPVKTRLESDGMLNLRLPTGLSATDVEVLVVVQPVPSRATMWPGDFFVETYGAFVEYPIKRGNQGTLDEREVLR